MGIKQLHNDNLRKLPNEYGDVSVMIAYFVTSCQPINLFYCPLGFGEMGVLFVLPGP